MEADEGLWKLMVTPTFAKYGINLPWEKFHRIFNAIYVIVLFAFGIGCSVDRPSCLPTHSNISASAITVTQAVFIADYCSTKAPWNEKLDIRVGVIALVFYIEFFGSFFAYTHTKQSTKTMSFFFEAERIFSSLNLPLPELERIAMEPDLACPKSSTVRQVREVVSLLLDCGRYKIGPTLRKRERYLLILLTVSTVGMWIFTFLAFLLSDSNSLYNCELSEYFLGTWSFNGTAQFSCNHPWTLDKVAIQAFYLIAVTIHCYIRFTGWRFHQFLETKGRFETLHTLTRLWKISRPIFDFGRFVKHIFWWKSETYLEQIQINFELVGLNADPEFTAVVLRLFGTKQTCISMSPNLRRLIQEKRWDFITGLLRNFPEPFNDPDILSDVDPATLDSDGFSLLYHVLNREKGCEIFDTWPAERILKITAIEDRVVHYGGGQLEAKEFVERQYTMDPTYPDRAKERLLTAIRQLT